MGLNQIASTSQLDRFERVSCVRKPELAQLGILVCCKVKVTHGGAGTGASREANMQNK